jgi:putative chitinase
MAKIKKTAKLLEDQKKNSSRFLSQIKWGESYTSLFLGAVVVVVALFLVLSLLKSKNTLNKDTGSTSTMQNKQNTGANVKQKTYNVKSGDDLWHIAQNLYGSGYNWVDLASANNLSNPSMLYVGTKLNIPNVKQRVLTPTQIVPQEMVIKGNSYIIQKGDSLWDIAIRAYGDGYKWVEIAKANNLSNPDIINIGNVLKLPR